MVVGGFGGQVELVRSGKSSEYGVLVFPGVFPLVQLAVSDQFELVEPPVQVSTVGVCPEAGGGATATIAATVASTAKAVVNSFAAAPVLAKRERAVRTGKSAIGAPTPRNAAGCGARPKRHPCQAWAGPHRSAIRLQPNCPSPAQAARLKQPG